MPVNGKIGTARVDIQVNTAKLKVGLATAKTLVKNAAVAMRNSLKIASAAMTGVATVGVLAFKKLASSAAESADEIDKMATRTGFSRKGLQELRFVGDQVGFTLQNMEAAMRSLNSKIPQLAKGTGDANAAFTTLGISIEDINKLSSDDLFTKIIGRLGEVENITERNALAYQIFGGRANALNTVIDLGAEKFAEYVKQAEKLGIIFSDEEIQGLVRYKDAMAKLTESVKALFQRGFVPLAIKITAFVETLIEMEPKALDAMASLLKMTAAAIGLAAGVGAVSLAVIVLTSTFGLLAVKLAVIGAVALTFGSSLVSMFFTAGQAIAKIFHIAALSIKTTFMELGRFLLNWIKDLVGPFGEQIAEKIGISFKAIDKSLGKMVDNGEEKLGMLSDALADDVKSMAGSFEDLGEAGAGAWDTIEESATGTIDSIKTAWAGIEELMKKAATREDEIIKDNKKKALEFSNKEIKEGNLDDAFNDASKTGLTSGIKEGISAGFANLASMAGSFGGGGGGSTSGLLGAFLTPIISGLGNSLVGKWFPQPAAQGRALGGPINQPTLVGERGPEMFVPTGSGKIVANHKMGGGGVTVNQNINVMPDVDLRFKEQLVAHMPLIQRAAVSGVQEAQARGG